MELLTGVVGSSSTLHPSAGRAAAATQKAADVLSQMEIITIQRHIISSSSKGQKQTSKDMQGTNIIAKESAASLPPHLRLLATQWACQCCHLDPATPTGKETALCEFLAIAHCNVLCTVQCLHKPGRHHPQSLASSPGSK
jgi:hypothetical protein